MPAKIITTAILLLGFFIYSLYPRQTTEQEINNEPATVLEEVTKDVTAEKAVLAKDDSFLPISLEINKISLTGIIRGEGLNDENLMSVPPEYNIAGWWKYGAKIGGYGNTILAGHFKTEDGAPGIFYNLNKLNVGDNIIVFGKNGQKAEFRIVQTELYKTEEFPTQEIYSPNSNSQNSLILITCAGDFTNGDYSKRLVLRAERI